MNTKSGTKPSAPPQGAQQRQLTVPEQRAEDAKRVRHQLEVMKGQFATALPAHVTPEKFVRTVQTAVNADPALLLADRTSLFASAMQCAADGLLPDKKEAAFVVFKGKVQYMPMIAGVLAKVRRSGELKSIAAHVVYEMDTVAPGHFTYVLGDAERIEHTPNLAVANRGKPIAVYAIAHTKDGGIYREVMSVGEVEEVRAVSRNGQGADSPWTNWWGEMARKTVLRRMAKRLPSAADLQSVLDRDLAMYDPARPTGGAQPSTGRMSPAEQFQRERELPPESFHVVDGDGVIDGEFTDGTPSSPGAAQDGGSDGGEAGGPDDSKGAQAGTQGGETVDEHGEVTLTPQANALTDKEGEGDDGFPGDRPQKNSTRRNDAR